MQTIAALAIIMFLLGIFFGLPYHEANQRRRMLMKQEKDELAQKKNGAASLDKSASSS